MGSPGIPWDPLGFPGVPWGSLGFTGWGLWVPMRFPENHCGPLGSARTSRWVCAAIGVSTEPMAPTMRPHQGGGRGRREPNGPVCLEVSYCFAVFDPLFAFMLGIPRYNRQRFAGDAPADHPSRLVMTSTRGHRDGISGRTALEHHWCLEHGWRLANIRPHIGLALMVA